jgi:O-antigen ligase
MSGAVERSDPDGRGGQPAALDGRRITALALTGAALLVMLLTLQPFSMPAEPAEPAGGGNLVNQVGYLLLAVVYGAAAARLAQPPLLRALLSPVWLVALAVMLLSLTSTQDPGAGLRGILLTVLALIPVAGVLVLPPSERDFAKALSWAAMLVLGLCYGAVLLAPDLAIHSAAGVESWHAGLWKAHLSHKNFAAPLFSVLLLVGVYCWWSGMRLRGAAIAVLAGVVVWNTGSKTTLGFLPFAIGLVMFGRITGARWLTVSAHAVLFAVMAALTLGTVLSPGLREFVAGLTDDVTFTGRDEIWRFALSRMEGMPFFGYGFGGFWLSPMLTTTEVNPEAAWDVRAIVSGHNNYIDFILNHGFAGGLILIYILLVRPLFNYVAAARAPANRNLADLFAMIIIFISYVALLETLLLNRGEPVWLVTAMAVIGLHLAAKGRVGAG